MAIAETPIERAVTFETAIEIIPREEIALGIEALKWRFRELFPNPELASLVPVMQAGVLVGRDIARQFGITMNPIRMSYYKEDGIRLESPVCKAPLDIYKVVDLTSGITKPVVFTEAVVDTQGTLLAAMQAVQRQIDQVNELEERNFAYPEFYIFALLSKIDGDTLLPNLNRAFDFHKDIWAFGYGCDADGKARTILKMMGYKSPFAKETPRAPYFSRSELTREYQEFPHWAFDKSSKIL